MSKEVLVTENFGGNWHEVRININRLELAPYVLQFSDMIGYNTIVLFRMPEDLALLLTAKGLLHYKSDKD